MPKKYSTSKFHQDGSARRFPGNTVICHIPKDSPVFTLLQEAREEFRSQPWASKFAFLPPSSYHMTVFEGVCDQHRSLRNWTRLAPPDVLLTEIDSLFAKKWETIPKPEAILMEYAGFWGFGNITLRLKPSSARMNNLIRQFRDTLAEHFELKIMGHEGYQFHISLAYRLQKLTFTEKRAEKRLMKVLDGRLKKEFGTLQLVEPELTFFEDMTSFAPARDSAVRNCPE